MAGKLILFREMNRWNKVVYCNFLLFVVVKIIYKKITNNLLHFLREITKIDIGIHWIVNFQILFTNILLDVLA